MVSQKAVIKTKRMRLNMGDNQETGTFRIWPTLIRRGSTPGLAARSLPKGNRYCRAIEAIVSRGRMTCLLDCLEDTRGGDGWLRVVGARGFAAKFGAGFSAVSVFAREAACHLAVRLVAADRLLERNSTCCFK